MKPNPVLWTVIAIAGAAALALLVVAAEAHGKRRQLNRAYLTGPGGTP